MKKKFLISIISIALVIALGSTAVSAMQCGKYSYCTAGYLYAQSTAHLAVNADSTYTYINRISATVRIDNYNGGEYMGASTLTIEIYDQDGNSLDSVTATGVSVGGYLNLNLYASDLEGKNVTSVTAKYTVYGYNEKAKTNVSLNPANIKIRVAECEQ